MRNLAMALCGALCSGLSGSVASAQDYPSQPVSVIVPYAPGGATDIVARLVAEEMGQSLGQSFVVENKPGANGVLAIETLAAAEPDGHTLMIGNVTTNAITPLLYPDQLSAPYAEAVVPVARIASLPAFVVATTTNYEPRTFEEFIEGAKASPGTVRYASAGVGSFPHFDTEILAKRAGLQMTHIPISGGAAGILQNMAPGDAQIAFLNVASSASAIDSGQLVPLAVTTTERLEAYPDVPTMAEVGYEGVGTNQWQGLFAPAGTPPEVLEALHEAVVAALDVERVATAFTEANIDAEPTESAEDAGAWLAAEFENWQAIIDEADITLE